MSVSNLIKLATDPEQYSSGDPTEWMKDKNRQNQQHKAFGDAVVEQFANKKHKSVLDLGCGTGWLAEKLFANGVEKYVGIEPSTLNYKLAKEENPNLDIRNESVLDFSLDEKFDCVVAIMVMSHIENVSEAFKKIHSLLASGGLFFMISSTFHPKDRRLERNGRQYEVETIDEEQYVDKLIGGSGYGIADINRKPEYYIRSAKAIGFKLAEHKKVGDTGYSPKEFLAFQKLAL